MISRRGMLAAGAAAGAAALTAFGRTVSRTYGRNLLAGAEPARTVRALTGEGTGTAWSPHGGNTTGTLELRLARDTTFDRIRLGEDIARGQHVERFACDAWTGTEWTEIATGTTIGYARMLPLDKPVTTRALRVRVTAARARPRLAMLGLHSTAATPLPRSGHASERQPG